MMSYVIIPIIAIVVLLIILLKSSDKSRSPSNKLTSSEKEYPINKPKIISTIPKEDLVVNLTSPPDITIETNIHNNSGTLRENLHKSRKESYEADLVGIEISDEFLDIYNLFENTNQSIFITGRAGTGKSTLLKYFLCNTNKHVEALAYTGVAALNIQGQTIHKFFKFPPRVLNEKDTEKTIDNEGYKRIDAIIIDEISMVRADLLDAINRFMKNNGRDLSKPFGGVQMIFFGDLYQLSPIVKRAEVNYFRTVYDSQWFFDAHVYNSYPQVQYKVYELSKIYRQVDQKFINLLDSVRYGECSQKILDELNSRVGAPVLNNSSDYPIVLTTRKDTANLINFEKLNLLPDKQFNYMGVIEGEFPQSDLPTEANLVLKKGAQVMFVKNDSSGRWVNGTLGKVIDLGEDYIMVEIGKGSEGFYIDKVKWEYYSNSLHSDAQFFDAVCTGTFTQYPIKLAWAITIHKSQGLTFNNVDLDLGSGAFTFGQTYVALSRCRSLEGISLRRPINVSDIKTDRRIKLFYDYASYIDEFTAKR